VQDGRANARPTGGATEGLDTGARIGRYVIVERVGLGAMGVVYGAYDPELDRKIALKLLKPGQRPKDNAKARLLREAKAIARLAHPNVVAVHDVGVFEDQVFLAMEFLAGGTIRSWLAERSRSWREILDVFVAAGRGLAAAHAAGLVHRDFKPDNVLLDREGRPRVVDFGIAREADGGRDDEDDDERDGEATLVPRGDDERGAATVSDARLRESGASSRPLLTLTKTGAMIGTPAYMAPEQFLGERGDDKSDQFSFCVALYEALYGERPFAGDDLLAISLSVTQEQLKPLPRDRGVPAWIRRAIVRGLRASPAARWPSMTALIGALADDPAVKLRRRLVAGGAIALVAASLLVARQMVARRHVESEREIARQVAAGGHSAAVARAKAAQAAELRRHAFDAFDALDRDRGEALWRDTRVLLPAIDAGYDEAEQAFEAALVLDPSRRATRDALADLRYEHLGFAADFRMENRALILQERLAAVDGDGGKRRALVAPGSLRLSTSPPALHVALERYERDPATGRRDARPVAAASLAGVGPTALPPGSYRLSLDGPGLAHVAYPFEVAHGERVDVDLQLPAAAAVPDGFVYVAPGELWFGDADEQLRTQFLDTVPIHRRHADAFLIARHETTFGEWIAFLESLPAAERTRHVPQASALTRGSLRMKQVEGGWQLSFRPASERYEARSGEPIVYLGRKQQARQDWLKLPVAGIDAASAEAYLGWLRRTGRVPGARLCTEVEWERAARGADDRLFPHGDELLPADADFDVTYNRVASAYGPDVVGTHPASRSPFGVDDLAGNAFEFVTSSEQPNESVIRGGAYFFAAATCRSTNREVVPARFRDVTTGVRVCASIQGDGNGKTRR
jgi:serine/threonine protein kinase/formylglycine-generating enzyme required for sulfatase activity